MNLLVSILPVFVFLAALIYLDSYKLVRLSRVLLTILIGCGVTLCAYFINTLADSLLRLETAYPRFVGPLVEEVLKSLYIIYLIRAKKVGFMVDAALYGCALGAGFAFAENLYKLEIIRDTNMLIWILRGFGTAIMHGGTTAIFGMIARNLSDVYPGKPLRWILPSLAAAVLIHSLFNAFMLPPVVSTILILILLPILMVVVFNYSEQYTRAWLGRGLDSDLELLDLITTSNLSDTHIGMYLHSLRTRFPPEVIGDMLCLIRIHTELSMRAKGMLLLREAGFDPGKDPELKEKFEELRFLENSLGKTGKMAVAPILHTSSRSLWQLYLLKQ